MLWALGLITALLTAFYMSRQVFMVFYGEARWEEAHPSSEVEQSAAIVGDEGEHLDAVGVGDQGAPAHHGSVRPHESGWLMLGPLVVLAFMSIVGGVLNMPFDEDFKFLEHWLQPVVEGNEAVIHESTTWKVFLAIDAVGAALIGISLAGLVYLRRRVPAERVERPALVHAWYYDETVTAFMGGPGREGFEAVTAFDANVVDGAVNGTAAVVREGASRLRLAQTGYVRNYALGLAVGAVLLVGLFLTQVGS
jgi:NADH-quinone oxidoreductase subunit L